jgi:hypothetical protein
MAEPVQRMRLKRPLHHSSCTIRNSGPHPFAFRIASLGLLVPHPTISRPVAQTPLKSDPVPSEAVLKEPPFAFRGISSPAMGAKALHILERTNGRQHRENKTTFSLRVLLRFRTKWETPNKSERGTLYYVMKNGDTTL